jgi:hypothetical protein
VGVDRPWHALLGAVTGTRKKQFFFEKKNQKTFATKAAQAGKSLRIKVFCFFFSKKKYSLLP